MTSPHPKSLCQIQTVKLRGIESSASPAPSRSVFHADVPLVFVNPDENTSPKLSSSLEIQWGYDVKVYPDSNIDLIPVGVVTAIEGTTSDWLYYANIACWDDLPWLQAVKESPDQYQLSPLYDIMESHNDGPNVIIDTARIRAVYLHDG